MNPSFIRLDDESFFISPTPVDQPLGEPVVLTRTAAHRLPVDGNGATGTWECTSGCFRRRVEQVEYSYIVSDEDRLTPGEGQTVELRIGDAFYFAAATQDIWDIRQTMYKIYLIFD